MPEHEPWLTALFNDYLAGVGNAILAGAGAVLGLIGVHVEASARPWSTSASMEVLVAVIIMVMFAILRPGLSVERPGKLQHIFEVIYNFLHEQSEEHVGHHGPHYLALFGTLFIFILFANLLGEIGRASCRERV